MSWPPESLKINTEDLINECELMEVMPSRGGGKQFIPVVEIAALLYAGEYIHAKYVWRRWEENNPPVLLQDWWRVGEAMMEGNPDTIWQGLSHISTHHPAPLSSYAAEVGTEYRKRILTKFPPCQPYLALLNFTSPAEMEQFCAEHSVGPSFSNPAGRGASESRTGLSQVVAFLESAHSPGTRV